MGQKKSFFVYGTLKADECRGGVFKQVLGHDVERCGGFIDGELYDLGAYPGVCSGVGSVFGEVVSLSIEDYRKMLPVLDMIEGYEEYSEHNLYIRGKVKVLTIVGEVEATTYFFANKKELAQYGKRLENGSWTTRKENL